jgi:sterol desaturase/sphingolipid hydroxylase (fatty acid hydroxylase superfamily)
MTRACDVGNYGLQRVSCPAGYNMNMAVKEGLMRFSSFWIFPAVAIAGIGITIRTEDGGSFRDLFWLLPVGLFAWTLLEYGLHRFAFHRQIRNATLRSLINGTHLQHHDAPRDCDHILVKPGYALAISGFLAGVVNLICGNAFWTAGILSGIWAGFLYYESVHYRVHATSSSGWLVGRQRQAHFYHHFHDSRRCFGVTTPLWDYVFGTARL